jgi:hypothetical protein
LGHLQMLQVSHSSVKVCEKLAGPEDDPFKVEKCSACYVNK